MNSKSIYIYIVYIDRYRERESKRNIDNKTYLPAN